MNAAIKHDENVPNLSLIPELSEISPFMRMWYEHDTFFAGIQYGDMGRLVLGYGQTVKQAVDAAVANWNG